ncbi:hypothetical protein Mapa_014758 [Marchantia paleacea]|nr:hypothetical protein Mapa_014758 [Marchantia paleacea]
MPCDSLCTPLPPSPKSTARIPAAPHSTSFATDDSFRRFNPLPCPLPSSLSFPSPAVPVPYLTFPSLPFLPSLASLPRSLLLETTSKARSHSLRPRRPAPQVSDEPSQATRSRKQKRRRLNFARSLSQIDRCYVLDSPPPPLLPRPPIPRISARAIVFDFVDESKRNERKKKERKQARLRASQKPSSLARTPASQAALRERGASLPTKTRSHAPKRSVSRKSVSLPLPRLSCSSSPLALSAPQKMLLLSNHPTNHPQPVRTPRPPSLTT